MNEARDIALGEGRNLHTVQAGEGPDIVLIHGLLATSHDWLAGPFQRLADEGLRVTAIDRPGHGNSRRPRFEGTPRDQAKQIRDGLQALGVERPALVGHSFGCMVSLAYAELFPEAVSHLVLVAPVAFPEARPLEHTLLAPRAVPLFGPLFSTAAEASVDRPILKLIQRMMFSPQPVDPHWEESYPYDKILNSEAMVFQGEDAAAMLPGSPAALLDVSRIATPAHILTGTADKIVAGGWQARQLARLMPNARLVEADGVGHMLHHVRPDIVVDSVREALASA